ncbi:MAG: hypothetical protein AYK22_03680 [Thermoplasmatales archaeon SG8-52-3]|nr:MAG: hypothetical protein AYK22_03680 [Thermoplasmatales archaeon SG8-52-3]
MKIKKPAMCITLFILLIISNIGCIFPESNSFTILSKTVIDDNGFPSLKFNFKANDIIKVKLIAPNKNIIFSDNFYSTESEIIIPLTSYRNNPQSGLYEFMVYDKNDNLIYNENLRYNETNLSIISFNGHWWKENTKDSNYSLIGITLLVKNNGDLPSYPYYLDFVINNNNFLSKEIIPGVVLPGETQFINCSIYIEDIKDNENNINVSILDKNDKKLAKSSFLVVPQENMVINNFIWEYNGENEINLPFPTFLFDYYSSKERLDTNDYAAYVFDPYDEQYLLLFIEVLMSISEDLDNVSIINLLASFVQNLEYGEDDPLNSSIEYPLFPIEILNKKSCDCEDRSIFVCNVLMLLGYNVSLISLPKHMAVGVNLDENLSEYDYYVDDYFYLETIEKNSVLGYVPLLYKSIPDQAVVYPITSRPIINHKWKKAEGISVDGNLKFVKLKLIVENIGNLYAEDISITGAFISSDNSIFNEKENFESILQPLEKKQLNLKLDIPKDIVTILKTKLFLDDTLVDEKQSTTTFS